MFGLFAATYVLKLKLRKQDIVKSKMKRMLKARVTLGGGTKHIFDVSSKQGRNPSVDQNTKVTPLTPLESNAPVVLDSAEDEMVAQKQEPTGTHARLAMRRQKTRQLAESNRQSAAAADWM